MLKLPVKPWSWVFLCALVFTAPWAAAQAPFKRLVFFGTSLSDPGNAYAIYGGVNTPPNYIVDDFLVPPAQAPYAKGGHHFSNGAAWAEQLARSLRMAPDAQAALRSASATASNYAVGGARARADDPGHNFNLPLQVNAFLSSNGGVAASDSLYIVEIGANDVFDALAAFLGAFQTTFQSTGRPDLAQLAGFSAANDVLLPAVQSIGGNVLALIGAGAHGFLAWNVPDIGLTPAVARLAAAVPALPIASIATGLTANFNSAVEANVWAPLEKQGVRILRLDVFASVRQIVAAPAQFGLANVSSACITPGVPPFECKDPDQFLFWDGIHPTAAGHALIAQQAASLLTH